jgi:glutaredoxin 3
MSTSRVLVYSTSYCGYCRQAEALLRREGIAFEAVDVTNDPEARADLIERAQGRRTVPVIFIDGEPIGGYQELAALSRAGELKHLSIEGPVRPPVA